MARTRRTSARPPVALNQLRRSATKFAADTRAKAISGVRAARKAAEAGVTQARERGAEAVTRLEKAFEQGVSMAIARLGVPTTSELRALSRQVAQLEASVERLRRSRARTRRA